MIRTIPTFELQQLQRKKRFVSKSKGKNKPLVVSSNSSNKRANADISKRSKPSASKK